MFRTLLVEDNSIFRQSLRETLGNEAPGMEIIEAGDGKEALKKIDDLHPKIVFMDIGLPGENGLKVTKKIKARHPETIVIILTSHDLPEYREEACRNGADFFVSKDREAYKEIMDILDALTSQETLTGTA
jgi:DNA-binding NarL/FixJ family response regulator